MGRLAGFSYREVTLRLRHLGFTFDRHARGSHEVWRNWATGVSAVVPRHAKDIPEGTLRSILRDAGISPDDFLA